MLIPYDCVHDFSSRLSYSGPQILLIVYYRLKYICNKEGMKTSSIALTALAEHTGKLCISLLRVHSILFNL